MTIAATNAFSGPFAPNGTTTDFPFTFAAMSANEIQVERRASNGTNTVIGGYSVVFAGQGGTVHFSAAPAAGDPLYIISNPFFDQQVSFGNQGNWSPSTMNGALDRAAIRDVFLRDAFGRTLRGDLGDYVGLLPASLARSGMLLGFDLNGNPIATTASGSGAKGDPGSPGEGYGTRTAMAARAAPALLDDVHLNEKGREGKFVVDLASSWTAAITADTRQGTFVISTADAAKVYRRVWTGRANVWWWGVYADGTTDDSPAFTVAIATLKALAGNLVNSYYIGGPGLFIPAGKYYLGTTTIDITHTLIIEGEGNGQNGGAPTWLKWAVNTTGIRAQRYNTSGDRIVGATHNGADGSIIRGLYLQGAYTSSNGPYHGIDSNARITVQDCASNNWQGNGINILANSLGGSGSQGNANGFAVERCMLYSNQNGILISGSDANAGYTLGCDIGYNRACGILDSSFLGNTHMAHQTAANVGAPYKSTDPNARIVFLNCYAESGQPSCSFASATLAVGGLLSEVGVTGGAWIRTELNALRVESFYGNTVQIDTLDVGASQSLNYGAALAIYSAFHTGNSLLHGVGLNFAGTIGIGVKAAGVAGDLPLRLGGSTVEFYAAGGHAGLFDASSLTLDVGKVLKIGSNKVIGDRLSALPADATDLATALTLVNAIKARLKVTGGHGLVAD